MGVHLWAAEAWRGFWAASSSWKSLCRLCDSWTDPEEEIRWISLRYWCDMKSKSTLFVLELFYVVSTDRVWLTVNSSSSEKSFLNFPGTFCRSETETVRDLVSTDYKPAGVEWVERFTSQVWLRRLTEAVFKPMMMANEELRFLCALQLKHTQSKSSWLTVCSDRLRRDAYSPFTERLRS